jgi:hypothetical protein
MPCCCSSNWHHNGGGVCWMVNCSFQTSIYSIPTSTMPCPLVCRPHYLSSAPAVFPSLPSNVASVLAHP